MGAQGHGRGSKLPLAFSSRAGPRVLLMCSTAFRTPREARGRGVQNSDSFRPLPIDPSFSSALGSSPPHPTKLLSAQVLTPPAHGGSSPITFPHLSPGSGICLRLSVPGPHRCPWKLRWAQLLGIGLGGLKGKVTHSPLHPQRARVCSRSSGPGAGAEGDSCFSTLGSQAGRTLGKGIPEKGEDIGQNWGVGKEPPRPGS